MSSHRQLQNHRNKTVERWTAKHSELQLQGTASAVARSWKFGGGCGDLAGGTSCSEGLVSGGSGDS